MPKTEDIGRIIHALIVDDEEPGRTNLRHALARHGNWRIAGECANAADARAALASMPVDVVFLDIRMPKESGLAFARTLCELSNPPLVVFVTAYDAHAVEAFDIHALDYLLKPFDDSRLAQTLERAALMLELRQRDAYAGAMRSYFDSEHRRSAGEPAACWQQLTVRSVGRVERVDLDAVFWIGAAGNYVELHTAGRTILHRIPLSKLETHLPAGVFVRAHRGAIVRTDQCVRLAVVGDGSYLLTLRSGDEVAVSERHVAGVRAAIGLTE
jgi:two-component system, LytTR family, response regulator